MTDTFEVPEVETPVTPESGAPEVPPAEPAEEVEKQAEEERTFTRQEHEAAIQAAKGKLERRYEREYQRKLEVENAALRQQFAPKPVEPAGKPVRDSFNGDDIAYVEALTEWKATQFIEQRERQWQEQSQARSHEQSVRETSRSFNERANEMRRTNPDFDELIFREDLKVTDAMGRVIAISENGPRLALYLAKNPDEAARIANKHPDLAGLELGRLEAKIMSTAAKLTSSAPAPTKPSISSKSFVADLERMSFEDYEKTRAKQGARWAR